MTHGNQDKFGFLPSLEVLPFFDEDFIKAVELRYVAYASYGSIAREMLVGNLAGGILPWEIFASEILALPGQRDQWTAAFFSKPSPTELVLQTQIYRALFPDSNSASASRKIPAQLMIGIENRSSLTRHQFSNWLNSLKLNPRPKVVFKFLPMDQRLQGMPADALDGFIARSPWGMMAEEQKLGRLVKESFSEDVSQKLVTVCRKNVSTCDRLCDPKVLRILSQCRQSISEVSRFDAAAKCMRASGKPYIASDLLAKAALLHTPTGTLSDVKADVPTITSELQALHRVSMLSPRIAPTEQTSWLLASR